MLGWIIARRYLRGKRRRGFISLRALVSALGVALGTGVLVVALSLANGFEKEVRDRIVGTLAHAKILQYHGRQILNPDSLQAVIARHPLVLATAPYLNLKGGIDCEGVQEGVIVMAVDAKREVAVTDVGRKVKFGEFSLDSVESRRGRKLPGMIIGIGLANKLGLRPGGELVLMGLATADGALDPTPRMERFAVSGVFETGMYEYDLNLIYISIPSAQDLYGLKGVEGIQIRTTDMFNADKIADDVVEFIGGYPYHASDWKSQNKTLFQWMKLEKIVIFIVISLIMLVAAFNILSSQIMMVFEKRREIGILMGMGAKSGTIVRVFMLNGVVTGLVGSIAGIGLALALCYVQQTWKLIPLPGDIYFISSVPVQILPLDVALVLVVANLICWFATIYPGRKAASTPPAESMRFE